MSITIKDIAKLAGVSHTTVSRALNDSPLISEETKQKIRQIAEEHNYIPNYSARSLKLDKSFNIGLFFTTIDEGTATQFFQLAVQGVNKIVKSKNYNTLIKGITDYKGDYSLVNKKQFDGIIVVSQSKSDDSFIDYVVKQDIPIVVVNRDLGDRVVKNISYDDRNGAYEAVNHLIGAGHEAIAFIKGKKEFTNTLERESGYYAAMMEHELTVDKGFIASGNFSYHDGYKAMKKILDSGAQPTAAFVSNDEMALGAIKAIVERELSVPEDISIIGFDNSDLCDYLMPELTSVNRAIDVMTSMAAEHIFKIVEGKKTDLSKVLLKCQLVERKSVKNIK